MENPISVVSLFAAIGIAVSFLSHWAIKHYLIASMLAALFSSISYQLVAYVYAGFLDPFFIMAFVNGVVIYFLLALVVGVPFNIRRRKLVKR